MVTTRVVVVSHPQPSSSSSSSSPWPPLGESATRVGARVGLAAGSEVRAGGKTVTDQSLFEGWAACESVFETCRSSGVGDLRSSPTSPEFANIGPASLAHTSCGSLLPWSDQSGAASADSMES